ncbi:MAG: AEC family transporter [Proteobacteria bacterium]|nr:AEC family transporter [Pseudomonadota bacterium]MDA1323714.1 AEC family transporter [Pseudomonadota bacterium]
MALISELSAIVLPIFICAGIGLLWPRTGQKFDSDLVSTLVYKISVPCLIIAIFAKVSLTPDAVAAVAGAALVIYLVTAAVAALVLRLVRLPMPSYLPSLMFPMVGSMGLPICLFAFGEDGLALALVFFTLGAIGTFTIGAAIAAGRVSYAKLISEPAIWAAVIAIGLLWLDLTPPKWILDTTSLLGGMAIPLQLIALGSSLAQFRVSSLPRGVSLSFLRLALGYGAGFGIAELFDLEGVVRAVVILQSAMPVAVSNYLFAVVYKREPAEVAGMILISTGITFVTLPLLLIYLL